MRGVQVMVQFAGFFESFYLAFVANVTHTLIDAGGSHCCTGHRNRYKRTCKNHTSDSNHSCKTDTNHHSTLLDFGVAFLALFLLSLSFQLEFREFFVQLFFGRLIACKLFPSTGSAFAIMAGFVVFSTEPTPFIGARTCHVVATTRTLRREATHWTRLHQLLFAGGPIKELLVVQSVLRLARLASMPLFDTKKAKLCRTLWANHRCSSRLHMWIVNDHNVIARGSRTPPGILFLP
mmetsp:Transcript_35335/g.88821  ORF Transcript_35335/g.88821 Transcript_35335/m.88821 type:complete len:235 (+) Transcript_35335:615-1319(+)